MSECLIDKNTGNVLYKPYLPLSTMFISTKQYDKMLKEQSKAEIYIMKNGVSQEEYDKYLSWKKRCIDMGCDESRLTYKEYEGCKLRSFVRKNENFSQVNLNEWSW